MTQLLDHRTDVATPEGVSIELAPAGPVVRIAAFVIDLLIRMAVLFLASIAFAAADNLGTGLFLVTYFLVEWFYPVAFEVMRQGQTPGKKAMAIAVVHEDGTPIRFSNSLLRNLLRAVDFLPVGYLFGLVSMVLSGRFQRLGDIVANTLVIHTLKKHQQTVPEHAQEPVYLTSTLTEAEQQAIIQFSMRANSFSAERREELVNILRPSLLENAPKPEAKLLGIANGLMGRDAKS